MKDKNKRNPYLKIRVNQKEMDAIDHKFRNSDMLLRFLQTELLKVKH